MGPLKDLILDVLPDRRGDALTQKEILAKFPGVRPAAIAHALHVQKKHKFVSVCYADDGYHCGHWWKVTG